MKIWLLTRGYLQWFLKIDFYRVIFQIWKIHFLKINLNQGVETKNYGNLKHTLNDFCKTIGMKPLNMNSASVNINFAQ